MNYRKWLPDLVAIGMLFVCVLFFFNTTLTGKSIIVTPDFGQSDVLHDGYPSKYFLREALVQRTFALWNPLIGTGYPLDGYPTGALYPLNTILFFLLPASLGLHWALAISLFSMGLGTYLFVRNLRISVLSSWVSAFCVAFSGTTIVQLTHFPIIESMSLFPWILLCTHQYITRRNIRWGIGLSLSIAFSIFIAFYQMTFYSILISGIYGVFIWVTSAFKDKKSVKSDINFVVFYVCFIALGIGLGAIQLLPSIQLLSQSIRQHGISDASRFQFPYPFKHVFTFLYPYLLGDPRIGTYPPFSEQWGIFWENTGYIGILPLILAGIGMAVKRKRQSLFWTILAIFLFFLVLGKNAPTKIVFEIPPLSFFRVPSRFLFFLVFSLSILSGYGWNRIESFFVQSQKRIMVTVLCLGIIVVDLFWFGLRYHLRGQTERWLGEPETVQFLKNDTSWFRITSFGEYVFWNSIFLKTGWQKTGAAYIPLLSTLKANTNIPYNIPQFNMYEALPTSWGVLQREIVGYAEQGRSRISLVGPAKTILNIAGVKYILSPLRIDGEGVKLVFTSKTQPPIYIYENAHVFPRAWIARSTIKATDGEQMLSLLNQSDIFSSTVLLDESLDSVDPQSTGTIVMNNESYNNLSMTVTMKGNGILVLADAYYPDWKAYIDGTETKIYRANINQRAIVVPTGIHEVKFSYEPVSFKQGSIISLISLSIIVILSLSQLHILPRAKFKEEL